MNSLGNSFPSSEQYNCIIVRHPDMVPGVIERLRMTGETPTRTPLWKNRQVRGHSTHRGVRAEETTQLCSHTSEVDDGEGWEQNDWLGRELCEILSNMLLEWDSTSETSAAALRCQQSENSGNHSRV